MLSITDLFFRKFSGGKKILFLLMLVLMASQGSLLAQDKLNKTDNSTEALKFGIISIENARSLIVSENINNAIGVYAQLVLRDTTDVTVNSEYAYALALGGIYDAALARLDRIWYHRGDNKEAVFFVSQVYALMGLSDIADEFGESQTPPAWVSSLAPQLLRKYKRSIHTSDNRVMLVTMFKQANRLTAQNYYLQALGRFGEITLTYPGEYLPYVGYSIALEKSGMFKNSAAATESAIKILGDSPENAETKQVLEQRLASLKNAIANNGNSSGLATPAPPAVNGTQKLIYAGGLIGSSYTSLNGKFGIFMSKASYATFDAGFTAFSGSSATTMGFTLYQRGKIMAGGMGLSASFVKGSTQFFYKVSLGPSIMNKSGTASWDIFIDGQRSLSKDGITTMGLSIGRSIYFGKRK
jgi:hypothetical protein